MVDYELAQWINEKRIERYTDAQIKSYLLKYGYKEETINLALEFANSLNKKETKMGIPPSVTGVRIGTEHYDTMAIIAFISCFIFPLAALPLGILSLKHIKHNPSLKGKPFAIVGIVVGLIPIILIFLLIFGGLTLGFLKGMHGKVSTLEEGLLDVEPEPQVPTKDDPFTLSRQSIRTHSGEMVGIKVGFFNPTESTITNAEVKINPECSDSVTSNKLDIKPGKSDIFNVFFTPKPTTGVYLCGVTIGDYLREFTMKVVE